MSELLLSKIAVNSTKLTVPLTTDMLDGLIAPETCTVPQPVSSSDITNRSDIHVKPGRFLFRRRMTTACINLLILKPNPEPTAQHDDDRRD
jgi:hypothetical protein